MTSPGLTFAENNAPHLSLHAPDEEFSEDETAPSDVHALSETEDNPDSELSNSVKNSYEESISDSVFPGPHSPDLSYLEPVKTTAYKIFQPITLKDAIQSTIDRQLEIKIAQLNVNFQRGVIQESAGPFDPIVTDNFEEIVTVDGQYIPLGLKTDIGGKLFNNFVSVVQTTRLGTIFTLQTDMSKIHNLLLFDVGLLPNPRISTGNVILRMEQALFRGGLGQSLQTQQEIANIRELDAVKYDVLQTISEKILATINTYWDFVAAIKALKIQQDAVKRFENLMQKMRRLIDAQEIAATDIIQVQASLAIKKQNEIASTYNLYLTMKQLLFAMGAFDEDVNCRDMDFDQIIGAFLKYPDMISDIKSLQTMTDSLINYALVERFDIIASTIREEVAAIVLRGLYNQTLPEVNLFGQALRSDFKTGKKRAKTIDSALYFEHPELNWSVGLTVSFPCFNDAAIGAYKQGAVTLQQTVLQTAFIKEQVIRDILLALKNQIELSYQIEEADAAVDYFEKVVKNESEKISAGFTTIFELISYENSLSDALILQNSLYAQHSQNIANLRFFSGTLVKIDGQRHFVVEDIASIPSVNPIGRKNP